MNVRPLSRRVPSTTRPPLRTALLGEEFPKLRGGFVREHPVDDVDAMVHGGRSEYIDDRPRCPYLRIAATEHQPLDARRRQRAGAHRTRLLGDVERTADAPAAERSGGRADGEHLGVRGRIRAPLLLVARFERASVHDQNGADRNVTGGGGLGRQRDRAAHVFPVLGEHRRIGGGNVLPARLERATFAFGGRHSIQLSYRSAYISPLARCRPGMTRVPRGSAIWPGLARPRWSLVFLPAAVFGGGGTGGAGGAGGRQVLEEVELVLDQAAVELADAVGVTEEIGPRVRQIVPRAVRHVVADFDLFHLRPVDRVRAEIAGDRRHEVPREKRDSGRI